jgi:hypothetical protein
MIKPEDRGQTAWSAAAARDRLSSTTFLAALFHGILILGITFSAPALKQEDLGSSMDVVLVTSEQSDRTAPENAVLLGAAEPGRRRQCRRRRGGAHLARPEHCRATSWARCRKAARPASSAAPFSRSGTHAPVLLSQ